jgi:UDP-N-acetylglucosamine 1-carboxyvinyltransferase
VLPDRAKNKILYDNDDLFLIEKIFFESYYMSSASIIIEQSSPLCGEVTITGAKNAVLVIMASLILTSGKSRLMSVPASDDVFSMMTLLQQLGAEIMFDTQAGIMIVDTQNLKSCQVSADIMRKIRASILVMGPLLARFGRVAVALPGGDMIGARPIDFHLRAFTSMGADIEIIGDTVSARVFASSMHGKRLVLSYPSVGATENILMAAVLSKGTTHIINAAIEPEVIDLIDVLRKMGAHITILPPATIIIEGVEQLHAVEHSIMPDRLEAGTLLLAAAITKGSLSLPQAPAFALDVFLESLQDMGHSVTVGADGKGILFTATHNPRAVSFRTMPYPGFPTDLQAPMMAVQCLADGVSVIQETVYENRFLHVRGLQKMGAQIAIEGSKAVVKGVDELYGDSVIATDIRAAAALVLAGLAARGHTLMSGVHHLFRGYQDLPKKLNDLGGKISLQ